ncbi:nitrous oxide reductase accessory protein NosL [Shimia thalassica]|uniref:nitrous oxide reductase accessory protein NosL n=1 Tax=Shimia thalassica TaxID=1715693 RepID=UPI002733CB43|nr:nitrous oxide reductase accessory protein NosL [Shimia thalassica]MDP2492641.1 nitrous oxide reductase accessory protein NosL [Shimia thalassica]
MKQFALVLMALAVLGGCKEEAAKAPPAPVDLTETALSYFCQMNIAEHGGPKGQIHLEGYPAPIFFAQVRDLVVYLKSPERDADIVAIYVSDMNAASSWEEPGFDNWIMAQDAVFVVGARVAGGMGAHEVVPFSNAEGAQAFVENYGGAAMTLDDIPDEDVLGPIDFKMKLETPS